jgi:hypothetical protein
MLNLLRFNLPFKLWSPWHKPKDATFIWLVFLHSQQMFHMRNITWAHYEHNKSGLLTINSISTLQTQHGMISDQIQHICNSANLI